MHTRKTLKSGLLLVLLLVFFAACSSDSEENANTEIVDQAVEKVAQTVVESIQQPLDKANEVKNMGDERAEKIKEAADD